MFMAMVQSLNWFLNLLHFYINITMSQLNYYFHKFDWSINVPNKMYILEV